MAGFLIVLLVFAAFCVGAVFLIMQAVRSSDDPLNKSAPGAGATGVSTKSKFDWGRFLLSLGPVVAGLGVLGLVFQYWDDYTTAVKLGIAIVALLVIDIAGLVLFELAHRQNNSTYSVLSKSLLVLGSFLLGGVLFLMGQALNLNDLNMQALLGLWFLGILPFTFIAKNAWQFGVNIFVGVLYIFNFLTVGAQIASQDIFGTSISSFSNLWFYYTIFCLFLLANAFLAGWLQFQKTKPETNTSVLLANGFQIFAFSALLIAALTGNIVDSATSEIGSQLYNILTLSGAGIMLLITLLAYFFGRSKPQGMWWLPSLLVVLASAAGYLNIPEIGMFVGFYLFQLPLLLWISWEYLQTKSVINGILFYTISSIFYFIWAVDENSLFTSLALLFGGIISLLLAMKFSEKKDYLIYTWIAVGLATLIKVIVLGLDASWVLFIAGLFLMLIGLYILRNRNKKQATPDLVQKPE